MIGLQDGGGVGEDEGGEGGGRGRAMAPLLSETKRSADMKDGAAGEEEVGWKRETTWVLRKRSV